MGFYYFSRLVINFTVVYFKVQNIVWILQIYVLLFDWNTKTVELKGTLGTLTVSIIESTILQVNSLL